MMSTAEFSSAVNVIILSARLIIESRGTGRYGWNKSTVLILQISSPDKKHSQIIKSEANLLVSQLSH